MSSVKTHSYLPMTRLPLFVKRKYSIYIKNLFLCKQKIVREESTSVRRTEIHLIVPHQRSAPHTGLYEICARHKTKQKYKHMVTTPLANVARQSQTELRTQLTNHTHNATFTTRHSSSKRCRKLVFEKTCCETNRRPTSVMQCLTYRYF